MHTTSGGGGHRSVWLYLMDTAFTHGFIDAGGVRTRYLEAGQPGKPTIIMLHGTGGSLDTFCANIGPFGEHFHVFCIDMIGSGFSAKPDFDYLIPNYVDHVKAFMEAAKISVASLLGVSLGSWIAARFALTHPNLVDKLILLSPSGMISNPATLQGIRASRAQAVKDPSWENIRTVIARLVDNPETIIDDHIAIRQRAYSAPEMKEAMPRILILQTPEVRELNLLSEDEWKRIAAKTLVIASLNDKGDYLKTAYRIGELNPQATVIEMSNVNHWPHFEKPDEFNKLAIDFLRA